MKIDKIKKIVQEEINVELSKESGNMEDNWEWGINEKINKFLNKIKGKG